VTHRNHLGEELAVDHIFMKPGREKEKRSTAPLRAEAVAEAAGGEVGGRGWQTIDRKRSSNSRGDGEHRGHTSGDRSTHRTTVPNVFNTFFCSPLTTPSTPTANANVNTTTGDTDVGSRMRSVAEEEALKKCSKSISNSSSNNKLSGTGGGGGAESIFKLFIDKCDIVPKDIPSNSWSKEFTISDHRPIAVSLILGEQFPSSSTASTSTAGS